MYRYYSDSQCTTRPFQHIYSQQGKCFGTSVPGPHHTYVPTGVIYHRSTLSHYMDTACSTLNKTVNYPQNCSYDSVSMSYVTDIPYGGTNPQTNPPTSTPTLTPTVAPTSVLTNDTWMYSNYYSDSTCSGSLVRSVAVLTGHCYLSVIQSCERGNILLCWIVTLHISFIFFVLRLIFVSPAQEGYLTTRYFTDSACTSTPTVKYSDLNACHTQIDNFYKGARTFYEYSCGAKGAAVKNAIPGEVVSIA